MSANILIVDDEKSIRDIFTDILEMEGYNVITAADGYEAMDKFSSENFHMAIIDINLPGPNGIEILKSIKETSEDLEVIMISGEATLDTAIESIRRGAYDYILKPFDIKIIPEIVSKGLEKQRQVIETKQLLAKLRQKTSELSVLYELRYTIVYTLNYHDFVEPIMVSLYKVIDHDISTFLFMFSEDKGELNIWAKKGISPDIIDQAKLNSIKAFNNIDGDNISKDMLSIRINEIGESELKDSILELGPTVDAELVICDEYKNRLAGMISVSSCRGHEFDRNALNLFHNVANDISNAIEKLTRVLAGEKYKLEMLISSMNDGVIMYDQWGYTTLINPAARRMLGLRKPVKTEHLAGSIGNTRLYRILDKVWNKSFTSSLALDRDGFEEEIYIKPSGRYINTRVSPIKDDRGKTHGVVAVLRDITKRKEIDEVKSAFVSVVSHELRTPLTAIKNAVSIIEMAGEINDQQKKFLDISMRNIDRLGSLINKILDFSKLEEGKLKMEFTLVNMKKLIKEAIVNLHNLAKGKSIEIVEKIPKDMLNIFADPDRIDQVLNNLVDNAIKYTPEGGRITIESKLVDQLVIDGKSKAMPQSLPNPGFVEISVSDTGSGIRPEDQNRIFSRFEQVGTSYEIGVGLGLSIVKKIIESHHGRIWVNSELGKGSKFTFIIPRSRICSGIINLMEKVDKEIETARLDNCPFSLILINVVSLSEIIKENGNNAKESVLDDMVEYIRDNTQIKKSLYCLLGNQGFVFCLYNGDKRDAVEIANQISETIQQQEFAGVKPVKIPVKTCVVTYPDDGDSTTDIIDAAVFKHTQCQNV
jgi:PAS domain S-box-containing protein